MSTHRSTRWTRPRCRAAWGDLDTHQAAQLDHDLGLSTPPQDEVFDEFVLHVDGWLCEIKDAQIRDGLHVLGRTPEGDVLINLVLAVLRSSQIFGGQVNGILGLRTALGLPDDARLRRWMPWRLGRASWSWHSRPLAGPLMPSPRIVDSIPETARGCCCGAALRMPRWYRGWPALAMRSPRSCTL